MPGRGAFAFPIDPSLPPETLPALWSPALTASIVIIDKGDGLAPLAVTDRHLHRRRSHDGTHIVVRAGRQKLRFWLRSQPVLHDTAFHLPLDSLFDGRVNAVRQAQLWIARGDAEIPDDSRLSRFQAARLDLMLELLDAKASGAPLRTLAQIAYPALPPLTASEWKASSERRGTHRLIVEAERYRDGGYRELLRDH
ncbi:DUF2285 domain-containing protein [Sphingobium sp.]|uniref:DUF2285 domain-containing protein n=1 Tax=Sphingobium sp. TaxID=1912891 RepID=UPI003B3A5734